MKDHSPSEMISGYRGSKTLAPGTYGVADLGGKGFVSFRPSADGVDVTALKANGNPGDAGTDVLAQHIHASVTSLTTADLVICQANVFTDITFTGQNITVYF